eukprot:1184060-Prorocentrum_minimum.AAC.1
MVRFAVSVSSPSMSRTLPALVERVCVEPGRVRWGPRTTMVLTSAFQYFCKADGDGVLAGP